MHRVLCSAGKDLKGSVFLEALAAREEPNRNGKMTVSLFSWIRITHWPFRLLYFLLLYLQSIVFIRDKNAKGQEISGYIDFAHRLKVHTLVDVIMHLAVDNYLILKMTVRNSMLTCISLLVNFMHVFFFVQMEDFDPYFASRRKLLPRHTDLSFYNWDTGFSTSNSTPNYQVYTHVLDTVRCFTITV